ncbi:MAG: oxygenase MpaB family protein, partial [Balneolaceae bacterium]|nr:oxygenase MpaB family protein [Balneolaceae bacterium]
TDRRVIETAQFVFDVMEKNWWEPGKRGILTALKVRIMHSAMRHIILYSDDKKWVWNEEWGKPISQEDLIATNQVFSLEFFKGMEMLGKPLSKEDQEAWFHTWKTIGSIMGVQDDLLADTVEEAWELQHAIYAHLFNDETKVGIHLADALVETIHQFHMPKKLVLFLMKTMLADEQFPDCFERMLGPTYKKDFEDLFVKDDSEGQKKKKNLHKEMHSHAMDCYNSLKDNKTNIKHPPHHTGPFERIIIWLLTLFGMEKSKVHMIEVHLEQLHKVLHHDDTGLPLEELEEDAILDMIQVFGGIIVAVLSAHFREGKESGFRIPKDLHENWALKG